MSTSDEQILPGSETDLALQRALDAANLRAGGATTAHVTHHEEPSAVDVGDLDGDGD